MKKKVHNQQESTGKKGRYSYIKARKNNQVLPKAMLSTSHHIGVLLKQAKTMGSSGYFFDGLVLSIVLGTSSVETHGFYDAFTAVFSDRS